MLLEIHVIFGPCVCIKNGQTTNFSFSGLKLNYNLISIIITVDNSMFNYNLTTK